MHARWDRNLKIYRNMRPPDKDDVEASMLDEPEKMIVPMSYAQVQTYAAFCYLLYNQNADFYQFNPTGIEDYRWRNAGEKTLSRDLRRNKWNVKLHQALIDIARFGLGVVKHWWVKDMKHLPTIIHLFSGDKYFLCIRYTDMGLNPHRNRVTKQGLHLP